MAQGGEPRQTAREIVEARTLARRRIGGERLMRTLAEDRIDQSGESGAGAGLDEGPHAVAIQLLDLGDELDRAGELSGEQVAGLVFAGRIRPGGRVGVNRY